MAIKKSSKPSQSEKSRPLSLAEIWDNTDPSEASNNLPAGEHEVRVNGIELKDDAKKGKAAIITYEAIEGDHEGKSLRQLYKLSDASGAKGPGVAYLMRDLALLGYENIDGKKLKKTLQEISEEQPMVIINAVENGQYTNAYLQGLPENATPKDDDDEDELEVGDQVTDGDEITGEIIKINKKKETAVVKDEDDEEHTCDLSDLTKVSEGKDGGEPESELVVGDKVEGEDDDGNDVTGTISKIKGDNAFVLDDDDDEKHTCPLDGLTKVEEKPVTKKGKAKAEPEPELDDEIEVGDVVNWDDEDGDTLSGTVKKIKGTKVTVEDEDEDEHIVKLDDLTKA